MGSPGWQSPLRWPTGQQTENEVRAGWQHQLPPDLAAKGPRYQRCSSSTEMSQGFGALCWKQAGHRLVGCSISHSSLSAHVRRNRARRGWVRSPSPQQARHSLAALPGPERDGVIVLIHGQKPPGRHHTPLCQVSMAPARPNAVPGSSPNKPQHQQKHQQQ